MVVKEFAIERYQGSSENSNDTIKLVQILSRFLPDYWRKFVPCGMKIVVADKSICALEEFNDHTAIVAKSVRASLDLIQVAFIGDKIYVHHNRRISKKSEKIFQYELLVVLVYAMYRNTLFLHLFNHYFFDVGNRYEVFANNFPSFLFPKSRAVLAEANYPLFERMVGVENSVKMATMC
jgi:hypothetical protein